MIMSTDMEQIRKEEVIFVAGHRGMVGAAIVRRLQEMGCENIITRTHNELDLADQAAVHLFFSTNKIDRVIIAAAKVGGIHANNVFPAEFIYVNLMIQANIIHQAYLAGIRNLLFLGSSCIYPKFAPQPMAENHLLTATLEPTNEPYAIAKIAGIKMCEAYNRQYDTAYRSVMPTNLFGPGDNYHLENSHVIPAMLRKYHLAKLAQEHDLSGVIEDEERYGLIPEDIQKAIGYVARTKTFTPGVEPKVVLWGSGTPKREFLHVDDMAAACLHVMGLKQQYFEGENPSFVNVGTGKDITIRETANIIAELVGFTGETIYNSAQPDGTPRKLLDTSRVNALGWTPKMSFREGLEDAYKSYRRKE
ncbi:MAG: GDP-L-fucose synthase [Desulforhopalus sp.]|jgi:GDP-L-fucose synthase